MRSAQRESPAGRGPAWLLLVHQLPLRPSNARVKTWRRLQSLGALPVKNSVYVLPNSAQAREDFEWIQTEIGALGGQATLFAADSVDSVSREELAAAFRKARQADFEAIRRKADELLTQAGARAVSSPQRRRLQRHGRQLRERWNQIAALDFFGAPGREQAASALERLERRWEAPRARPDAPADPGQPLRPENFRGKTWITRPRPGVDRMASAWLIRRFIDPGARFRFAAQPPAGSSALPFDMFGGEFSHQGNRCTFETLALRFAISNPAVEWIGRIVHQLDFKKPVTELPEAAAIGRLVEGFQQMVRDDQELLERGIAVLEALYSSYASDRSLRAHSGAAQFHMPARPAEKGRAQRDGKKSAPRRGRRSARR